MARVCGGDYGSDPGAVTTYEIGRRSVSLEDGLIEAALAESHGNKMEAARKLQTHRRLFYEKMEQLGSEKAE
jgi:two-component system NtrC family response regulator